MEVLCRQSIELSCRKYHLDFLQKIAGGICQRSEQKILRQEVRIHGGLNHLKCSFPFAGSLDPQNVAAYVNISSDRSCRVK